MIILQKNQIEKIEQLILDYSGIILERVTSRDISGKIARHMQKTGISCFEDYLGVLDSGYDDKPLLAELISELTVSESFFFRNPGQFKYLYEKFFPELFKKGSRHAIRIWSAGCAKGEEAYSLALVARKFQLDHTGCEFTIFAGDINLNNLQRAKEGTYCKRAFRRNVEEFETLLKCQLGTRSNDGQIQIAQELKEMVNFRKLNLKQTHNLKCLAGSDIIFCRNVLIYFSEEFRINLLKNFFNYLVPGGLLCLGESECLSKEVEGFETIRYKDSYCYRKPSGII
ncbi:MAG: protein-glutamate O-methyltransferase CheR [Candidatus Rifleibacteriota bacterium]